MEAETREGAQFDARGESPPQETGSRFKPRENVLRAGSPFNGGDVYIRIGEFPIHFYVRDENLLQARVADLADERLRKLLTDSIRYTLKSDSRGQSYAFSNK